MKHIVCIAALALAAFACDKVEDPFTGNDGSGGGGGESGVRVVLLEKLTGFRCTNCPQANSVANNLKNVFGEQLVVVGVHASLQFAFPTGATPNDPYYTDFRTVAGEAYYNFWGQPSLPVGLVSRSFFDGQQTIPSEAWAEQISNLLAAPLKADVFIENLNYDQGSRSLSFDVSMNVIEEMEAGEYFMTAYLVEDSIYDWQTNNNVNVENYLHRNVLRDNINGTWGALAFSSGNTGQQNTLSYQYTLDPAWKEQHCELVVYLYHAETREIIQAAHSWVMNP
ncbi:MAG: hypothetical protein EA392_03995 [Cryomorphaceae bacterium]|nr:MAG: hypothetical protein EA392_03995 [Cryomorphaceae bacterium]